MINFCKKSVHSLFNIASTTLTPPQEDFSADHHQVSPPAAGAGLSFLTTPGVIPKPNNVIESSSLINRPLKSNDAIESEIKRPAKRDRIEIGLRVLDGGDFDGLASCTESLGFESCNGFENYEIDGFEKSEKSRATVKSRKYDEKKPKLFPPPLSSLNDDGKPAFFLRPVRKNGRLELTEVKIHRQEILHACREDGRLRLHLVESDHKNDHDVESDHKLGDVKEEKIVQEEWKFPASSGGGEDCRWLHEMVVGHGHHRHNMHGWGQQCVTIR